MQKFLIIYAHPNKEGHSGTYLNEVTNQIENSGKKYELLDLYEINFDPVLKPSELFYLREYQNY